MIKMTREEGLNKLTQIMRAGPYEACEICGISEGVISIKLHEPKAIIYDRNSRLER
mgnify:CR=1 FL=1